MRRPLPRRRPSLLQVAVALGSGLLLAVASCSSSPVTPDAPGPDGPGPLPDGSTPDGADAIGPDSVTGEDLGPFPAGFLWGSASASFQAEGGNPNSDWSQWADTPGKVRNGDQPDDGPDYFTHFDEDHERAAAAGHNAIRISLEWSRVYPTAESFDNDEPDPAGLDFYDRLLDSIRDRGLKPMVTLHHLSTPTWLHDLDDRTAANGWVDPAIVPKFAEFARRMATRYGDRVDLWLTINEPQTLALVGYVAGTFPPGDTFNFDGARAAYLNMIRGHAAAYDAIREADTVDADGDGEPALVSFATHNRVFDPTDPDDADDIRAADRVRFISNHLFIQAVLEGNVDADFDGTFDGPDDLRDDPSLKGRLDFIALNYYGLTLVTYIADNIPILGLPQLVDLDTQNPKTDLGWDIYPQGLAPVLDELKAYQLPIHITENGAADQGDSMKARFVTEHLVEVLRAIGRGVDVRGYLYWSLTDNFEWAEGYCPRFGLWRIDYDSAERTRTPSQAVATLQEIIQANTVPAGLLDRLPPYGAPVRCSK